MTDTQRQLLPRHERRAQILRAAAAAFAQGGYAATSMEEVAASAGVTKLIVYRHFESKEALYRAVLETMSHELRTRWAQTMEDPFAERRGGTVRALLGVARENPDGYRLLVFHAPREAQFVQQAFGYWEDAVVGVDGLIGSHVRVPEMRSWVVRTVMSYLLHAVLLWLETGDEDADEVFVEEASAGLHTLVGAWTDLPLAET